MNKLLNSPEAFIVALVLTIILIAYFFVYPRTAKSDAIKVALYDIGASTTTLLISGFIFWNSGVEFSLYFINVNWFFFTLTCYALVEMPFMAWYFKKHKVAGLFS
jgi:hypothetical protein